MKYFLSLLLIASLNIPAFGQQIDCSWVGMSVASSGPNYVQLYHSGMYLLWPREPNVIEWEITDFRGNVIYLDTTRGTVSTTGTMAFNHNVPPTDSMLVSALIYNDSLGMACLNVDTLWWGRSHPRVGDHWKYRHQCHGHKSACTSRSDLYRLSITSL